MSEYCKNCEVLQQENEKLKRQINKIKDYTKHNMQYVDCDNWFERFIYTFEDWKKSLQNDTDRYKQALEEIEKITKCSVDQDCCECPLCTLCEELCINEDNLQRIILDIISKAKGEGNNEG